jgi:hypothetical protein
LSRSDCNFEQSESEETVRYLESLPYSERNIFTKFRIGVHNLEIEKGRHKNLPEHIRICTLCNCEVEDEIHFLMRCTKLKTFRENHLGCIFKSYPNAEKLNDTFIWLMSNENQNVLKELVKMIKILTNERNTLLLLMC